MFHRMEWCLWSLDIWVFKGYLTQYPKIFSMFNSFQALKLFRVDEAHEIQGLDVVKHNEPAYPIGTSMHF